MKLLNNIYLAIWGLLQWIVFMFAMLVILGYGTIIGGIILMNLWISNWLLALMIHSIAAFLLIVFYTYPSSKAFWALPFYRPESEANKNPTGDS